MRTTIKPKYSGPLSNKFWEAVNSLPRSENDALFILGCALQDLEARVLGALNRKLMAGQPGGKRA